MDSSNYKFLEMNFKENPQLLYGYLKVLFLKKIQTLKKFSKVKNLKQN